MDEKDQPSANIVASGAGRTIITATGAGEFGGLAVAQIDLVALDKDALAKGEIEISIQPAPARSQPSEQPSEKPIDKPIDKNDKKDSAPHSGAASTSTQHAADAKKF